MAKSKARKHARTKNISQARSNNHPGSSGGNNNNNTNKKKPQPPATGASKPPAQTKKSQHHKQALHDKPIIPFRRNDRILLIGEGDFSFARSLVQHHRCENVYATAYDSREELLAKYPFTAESNIAYILGEGDNNDNNEPDDNRQDNDAPAPQTSKRRRRRRRITKVLYSVDATKLGRGNGGGGKEIRTGIRPGNKQWRQPNHDDDRGGPWDIIAFNFPHVGGLSTDVNRQVRKNQELLVKFFEACVPLLSTSAPDDNDHDHDDDDDDDDDDDYDESEEGEDSSESESEDETIRRLPRSKGQIIVTLFEGEPYTLWNIKDLARHAGLRVVTSFRFPWTAYPGYSHARTLGVVQSRSGHVGGGWKGEDREARSYVFEVNTSSTSAAAPAGRKRKRPDDDSSSDED